MSATSDKKLLHLIRYAPVLIIGVFVLAVNITVFQENSSRATESIESLREEVITRQKELISQQVNQVVKQIQQEKNRTVQHLKEQAEQRVNEAYDIAINIYNNNQDKSKEEITKMISEALKPIRFYDGRGYFFIFQMDGINVMHALKPHLEGNSAWGAKDVRGTFILREHIRLIKEQGGEAFYNWWYQKPGEPAEQEFEKIGFGKHFEPYDWFIGTGEYVTDVEKDVQKSVLSWITDYGYGERGYLFVVDKEGKLLAHPNKELVGKNLTELEVSQNGPTLTSFLEKSKAGGGYVNYVSPYKPHFDGEAEKTSFVKPVDDWGWMVSTGFYVDDFEKYVSARQQSLESSNNAEFAKISILSLISTVLVIGISLVAGNLIAQRFSRFQERIEHDFGELEQTKDKMQYMALHDSLTGLPNRMMLIEDIKKGIEYARTNNKQLAIMFADLDDFKKVNDLYGHSSGDKLLEIISRKFETILGKKDTVSRFGGDEFIFCFPDLDDIRQAEKKVTGIREVFNDQFVIDGKILSTGCSIGVSMFPADSDDPESLIRKADIVLYKSKSTGKGDVLFYDSSINEEVQFDFTVEEELKRAIYKDEISVLYQPQVDVKSGKMVSVEALARWSNMRLGMVSPVKFISVAEETGLIHEIGLFVFRRACEDIYSLSRNGENALDLSVNISPKQILEPDFPEFLTEIAQDVGIDISRITLEITENVLLEDFNKVSPVLKRLRSLGFGISLDDFGTGYSSLSYLNNLPITEIKIDRTFVDKLLVSQQSDMLVKAIIAIGHSCDMQIVAEGVETKEQYDKLVDYGCGHLQGYYFDRPVPMQKISGWNENQAMA